MLLLSHVVVVVLVVVHSPRFDVWSGLPGGEIRSLRILGHFAGDVSSLLLASIIHNVSGV